MSTHKEKSPGPLSSHDQLQLASNKFGLPSSQGPRLVCPEWLMSHRNSHPNPYEAFGARQAKLFIDGEMAHSGSFRKEPTATVDTNPVGGDNGPALCRSPHEAHQMEDYMQQHISQDSVEKENCDTSDFNHHGHQGIEANVSSTRLIYQFTPMVEANTPRREDDNSFTFSPGQLNKMLNPKCLKVFYSLGGINGLDQGLKTNLLTGIGHEPQTEVGSEAAVDDGKKYPGKKLEKIRKSNRRKRIFRENQLSSPRTKRFTWVFHNDKVLAVLIAVAVASLVDGLSQILSTDEPRAIDVKWVEAIATICAMCTILAGIALDEWIMEHLLEKVDQEVKVGHSGVVQTMPANEVLVGDVLYLDPGDLILVDGIFIDGYTLKCDESSAIGELEILRETPRKHVASSADADLDPFVLSGRRVVGDFGTVIVTPVGEHSGIGSIMMSTRENEADVLKIGVLSLVTVLNRILNLFIRVSPNVVLALSLDIVIPRVQIGVGYSCPDLFLMAFFCFIFVYVEDRLVKTISIINASEPPCDVGQEDGHQPKASELHKALPGFKNYRDAFGDFAPQSQSEPFLQEPTSSLRHGTGSTSTCASLVSSHRIRGSENWKRLLGFFVAFHSVPLAAAAFTVARSARIASGITSAISGVTVIPLRTADDFPAWSWALTYGVWAATFSVYLWLQTQRIPPEVKSRRELYLFCVIMAAVHFTIAISQALTSILDAITLYGPILLTTSAYLMSLLHRALNPRISHANSTLNGTAGLSGSGGNTENAETSSGAQRNETTLALALTAIGGGAAV